MVIIHLAIMSVDSTTRLWVFHHFSIISLDLVMSLSVRNHSIPVQDQIFKLQSVIRLSITLLEPKISELVTKPAQVSRVDPIISLSDTMLKFLHEQHPTSSISVTRSMEVGTISVSVHRVQRDHSKSTHPRTQKYFSHQIGEDLQGFTLLSLVL